MSGKESMSPLAKLLSSKIVWRLSGITYSTSIIATNGRFLSRDDYLLTGNREMAMLLNYFEKERIVLEFGCGPGKNLFGIADKIKFGFGLDINGLYIRLAKKLAKTYRIENISFLKYDGLTFPKLGSVDIVFEKGVFERLPKLLVSQYISILKKEYLKERGIMILYFLMERAKGTKFTKRLGDLSYVFWEDREIIKLLDENGLKLKEVLSIEFADFYVCQSM